MPTLDFEGKEIIHSYHFSVPYRPLVPDPARSLNPAADGEDNLIIHGDNLHALKALLPRYSGRVKCIYIDPPYNTGKAGWAYNDQVNSPRLREWFSKEIGREDLERHDKWACMMWPRLQLLRELLADDGVIFISIDDNEQHHLRMLMDEIFGDENFVSNVAVIANLAGSSDQFGFAGAHEYCLVYAKNRNNVYLGTFPVNDDALAGWHKDEIGYYQPEQLRRGSLTYNESLHYPIFVGAECNYVITDDDTAPATGGPFTAVYPIMGNGNKGIWRWSKNRILENPTDVFVERRDNGNIMVYSKQRPQLGDLPTAKPKSVFYKPEYGTRAGGSMLSQILPDTVQPVPYPKAVALLTDILRIGAPNAGDIVLDSFAGSGTTGQAVLALNKDDGGNRKFILVECEDYADTGTAERVRRVINGVPDAKGRSLREGLGGSFTYCTLGKPLEVEGMLNGDLPDFGTLAAYLLYTAAGITSGGANLQPQNKDGLFYSDDRTDYHLIYQPNVDRLCSDDAALTAERAQRIRDASRERGRSALVYAACKYISQRALTRMGGIRYCQLPYEIHHPSA